MRGLAKRVQRMHKYRLIWEFLSHVQVLISVYMHKRWETVLDERDDLPHGHYEVWYYFQAVDEL